MISIENYISSLSIPYLAKRADSIPHRALTYSAIVVPHPPYLTLLLILYFPSFSRSLSFSRRWSKRAFSSKRGESTSSRWVTISQRRGFFDILDIGYRQAIDHFDARRRFFACETNRGNLEILREARQTRQRNRFYILPRCSPFLRCLLSSTERPDPSSSPLGSLYV